MLLITHKAERMDLQQIFGFMTVELIKLYSDAGRRNPDNIFLCQSDLRRGGSLFPPTLVINPPSTSFGLACNQDTLFHFLFSNTT